MKERHVTPWGTIIVEPPVYEMPSWATKMTIGIDHGRPEGDTGEVIAVSFKDDGSILDVGLMKNIGKEGSTASEQAQQSVLEGLTTETWRRGWFGRYDPEEDVLRWEVTSEVSMENRNPHTLEPMSMLNQFSDTDPNDLSAALLDKIRRTRNRFMDDDTAHMYSDLPRLSWQDIRWTWLLDVAE